IHGSLIGTAPNLTYTPENGYVGTDVITFKVNDGLVDSGVGVITINMTFTEVAPQTSNLNFAVNEDESLIDNLEGIDENEDEITFIISAQPTHGTVSVDANTGEFTYIPNADYYGTDFFGYRGFDGTLYSNLSIVTVTVLNVNDIPIANN